MSKDAISWPELETYMEAVGATPISTLRQELVEETKGTGESQMQISQSQAEFMRMFTKIHRPMKCFEVGVFTGMSTMCVAEGLPEGGKIYAMDISEEWTSIARKYWERAGVSDKIELTIGPAADSLDRLIAEDHAGTFDFGFIDADKCNQWSYFDKGVELLRPGGVIFVDNTLWEGKVLTTPDFDENTRAMIEFNRKVHEDTRIDHVVLTIRDGITFVIKK
jgi:predicted O-methyltransferase YrrM